jgi:hypothetical protein
LGQEARRQRQSEVARSKGREKDNENKTVPVFTANYSSCQEDSLSIIANTEYLSKNKKTKFKDGIVLACQKGVEQKSTSGN